MMKMKIEKFAYRQWQNSLLEVKVTTSQVCISCDFIDGKFWRIGIQPATEKEYEYPEMEYAAFLKSLSPSSWFLWNNDDQNGIKIAFEGWGKNENGEFDKSCVANKPLLVTVNQKKAASVVLSSDGKMQKIDLFHKNHLCAKIGSKGEVEVASGHKDDVDMREFNQPSFAWYRCLYQDEQKKMRQEQQKRELTQFYWKKKRSM